MLCEEFAEVIDAARAGSRPALARLYEDLQPNVLAYLRARDRIDAEDIASDVWVSVAAGLRHFHGDESGFRGWLFTIVRRRLADARRRRGRRPAAAAPPEAFLAIPADADLERETLARLDYEAALRCLEQLVPDQQDVVLLRVVAELTVEEVGHALGKRPGTVRVLQHRALRRLAELLGEQHLADDVGRNA